MIDAENFDWSVPAGRMPFAELHRRICDALRGNRAPVVAEVFPADGTHRVIRGGKAK